MPITLYTTRMPRPSARVVETVIRILKLDVQYREVNLRILEHFEPWFVKLSPASDVPVLDDNGYILTDSDAIISYLFTVYAPKDILEQYFPTDPKQRGIINSRLHFLKGVLCPRIDAILLSLLFWTDNDMHTPLENTRWLVDGIEDLDKILEGRVWLAADRLTVADISAITMIDPIEALVPLKHYKNVSAWAERVRLTSPFYDIVGIEEAIGFIIYLKHNSAYDAEDRWNKIQSGYK